MSDGNRIMSKTKKHVTQPIQSGGLQRNNRFASSGSQFRQASSIDAGRSERIECLVFSVILMLGLCSSEATAQWQEQAIHSKADFRGLCVVSEKVVWFSGTQGTFGRTVDGGKKWSVGTVAEAESLDFRDVEAFGETNAYLLSIGPGEKSRIYRTSNGGQTWILQFKNPNVEAFFDAMAFWDEKHGVAISDPVNGKFQLISTDDGGATWKQLAPKNLPSALPNESAFAASGTSLVTFGERELWFCTGGAATSRVFYSGDRGQSWTVTETPILAGRDSAGIFSIAFRERLLGVIVGGDYRKPNDLVATSAATSDGGKTWNLIPSPLPFRSAIAWAKDRWVAVGTSGSNVMQHDALTWTSLDQQNYNSVAFTATGEGWAVGPKGRVARFAK